MSGHDVATGDDARRDATRRAAPRASLAIQTFLRSGGTFDDLLTRYAIKAKRHREHENLVLLKYNQISSPFGEQIVRECRGIVLDESDDWRVVARAYSKFFNVGEGHAAPIDWATARVQEKVDGSLITLYPYRGRWHVATTGTPDAGGSIWGVDPVGTWEPRPGIKRPLPASFADYFWQVARIYTDALDGDTDGDVCFFFELTGPLNRVVVQHQHASLTLLGARCLTTGEELSLAETGLLLCEAIPAVREFPLAGIDDILSTFGVLSPLAQEGYVVVDGAFNRVKIKHPGYVALHHAKDGLSTRAFVEIARSGETPEVIAAFPELRPRLEEARGRLDAIVADVEADYARLRDIETQKAFALEATKTKCPAALFMIRGGKSASARDYFAQMQIDPLMRLLGYKAEKQAEAAE